MVSWCEGYCKLQITYNNEAWRGRQALACKSRQYTEQNLSIDQPFSFERRGQVYLSETGCGGSLSWGEVRIYYFEYAYVSHALKLIEQSRIHTSCEWTYNDRRE